MLMIRYSSIEVFVKILTGYDFQSCLSVSYSDSISNIRLDPDIAIELEDMAIFEICTKWVTWSQYEPGCWGGVVRWSISCSEVIDMVLAHPLMCLSYVSNISYTNKNSIRNMCNIAFQKAFNFLKVSNNPLFGKYCSLVPTENKTLDKTHCFRGEKN